MKPGSDPKVKEIICKRWFIKSDAITLYPWILYRPGLAPVEIWHLRKHEWVHVEQIHRMGWIRFYLTWIWYTIRYGYKNNPLEVEAYTKQNEL